MGHLKLQRALFRGPLPTLSPMPRKGWDDDQGLPPSSAVRAARVASAVLFYNLWGALVHTAVLPSLASSRNIAFSGI